MSEKKGYSRRKALAINAIIVIACVIAALAITAVLQAVFLITTEQPQETTSIPSHVNEEFVTWYYSDPHREGFILNIEPNKIQNIYMHNYADPDNTSSQIAYWQTQMREKGYGDPYTVNYDAWLLTEIDSVYSVDIDVYYGSSLAKTIRGKGYVDMESVPNILAIGNPNDIPIEVTVRFYGRIIREETMARS